MVVNTLTGMAKDIPMITSAELKLLKLTIKYIWKDYSWDQDILDEPKTKPA
jgi:hypothetical protein